ncbi:MAG: hypothetical protein M3065_11685, partial [Actinomycetota bacterium]|nr:hypothetical protein [Actinomycetota bacterium]
QAGKRTIVIAQTSNDHLDELNARAQAIRHQNRELGDAAIPIAGRPYQLHRGDEVQIRRTLDHPEHGQLRNGTTAHIADVDTAAQTIDLTLAGGDRLTMDRGQLDRAQLRLAYVQHPFPAQGQTTDTAHFIVSEHATQEGSYVALTRAREQTHLYAAEPLDQAPDADRLQALAERISRTEPDLPSIHTPLHHEHAITRRPDHPTERSRTIEQDDPTIPRPTADLTSGVDREASREEIDVDPGEGLRDADAAIEPNELPHPDHALEPAQALGEENRARQARRWPNSARPALGERDGAQIELDEPERHQSWGWEP